MKKLISSLAIAALSLATCANAVVIIENAPQTGSQSGFLLGMDFEVNSTIRVTEMGIFDSNQDGFSSLLNVGIFKLDSFTQTTGSTLVAGSSVSFGGGTGDGYLEGGSRFKDISDFLLGPGFYSIVAVGFTNTDPSGNSGLNSGNLSFNNLGGALGLTPKGGRWATVAGNTLALPTEKYATYGQSDPVFQAGTFKAVVPDTGSTLTLIGLGTIALAFIRRRVAK